VSHQKYNRVPQFWEPLVYTILMGYFFNNELKNKHGALEVSILCTCADYLMYISNDRQKKYPYNESITREYYTHLSKISLGFFFTILFTFCCLKLNKTNCIS